MNITKPFASRLSSALFSALAKSVRLVRTTLSFALALTLVSVYVASHAEIIVNENSLFMFHDLRGENNVGVATGDRLQYGSVNVIGGSAGTFLGATYPPSGFTDPAVACGPLAVNANFCSNTTIFNANRLAEPWTFTFTKSNEIPLSITGPSLAGTEFYVPEPTSVTISNSSGALTPTISWTLPEGYTPDGIRIQIWDLSRIRINGQADIIHNDAVSATASSYTIPSILEAGIQLALGGNYAINIQVIETRGDIAFTGSNTQIISRSSSFFNFTPLDASGPPNVFLPTVTGNGVFQFHIDNVGPDSITFIDPIIAIGYDYQIGAGDPNFASVLLPTGIGDDQYDLFLFDLGLGDYVDSGIDITGGIEYFFAAGGVDRFRIMGIETSAGLDPNDVTAFITGLTFVSEGSFTGTMTPITAQVPEPSVLALLTLGLLAIGFARRAKNAPKWNSTQT